MIFIKFTLKMDENYFSNFFHTIFRASGMPLLYFQNLKKMTYKSANSNKGLRPKMFLIGHRNLFLPNTWKPICNCPHFDKKSVSNRPIKRTVGLFNTKDILVISWASGNLPFDQYLQWQTLYLIDHHPISPTYTLS